jgi:hypothetical protein
MDSYRVISDVSRVPEMTDLELAWVDEPKARDGGYIAFSTTYQLNPVAYEPAVGARCRVIRTRDGQDQEFGGAVERVTPLRIALDGGGWHSPNLCRRASA